MYYCTARMTAPLHNFCFRFDHFWLMYFIVKWWPILAVDASHRKSVNSSWIFLWWQDGKSKRGTRNLLVLFGIHRSLVNHRVDLGESRDSFSWMWVTAPAVWWLCVWVCVCAQACRRFWGCVRASFWACHLFANQAVGSGVRLPVGLLFTPDFRAANAGLTSAHSVVLKSSNKHFASNVFILCLSLCRLPPSSAHPFLLLLLSPFSLAGCLYLSLSCHLFLWFSLPSPPSGASHYGMVCWQSDNVTESPWAFVPVRRI